MVPFHILEAFLSDDFSSLWPPLAAVFEIDGSLADSKTEPFHGTWHFERGVKYNSDFTRSGDGDSGGQLVSLEMLRAAPAATETKP
ncbi:MAG: hypothetical protein ACXW19_07715 [Thermoanaerobaculia bacterium]